MTDQPDQYAIHHPDGRWLYYLPNPHHQSESLRKGVFADGDPMTAVDLGGRYSSGWWATHRQAGEITAVYGSYATVTGHRLRETAALSERYPATLTPEEWRDHDDDNMHRFYETLTEPAEDKTHVYDGPFVVLESAGPAHTGDLAWVADLPASLSQRPEYAHCFPGYIPGLVSYVRELAQRMPHVEHAFVANRPGDPPGIKIHIRVPFADPKYTFVHDTNHQGRKLKRGREIAQTVTDSFHLPVRDRVHGADFAEARRKWDEEVKMWTSIVRGADIAACNTCDGKGRITTVPDPDAPATVTDPAQVTEQFPGELAMLRGLLAVLHATADADGTTLADVHKLLHEYESDERDAFSEAQNGSETA